LALFTPADVFLCRIDELAAARQAGLDAASAAHPERFVRGRPKVARPPPIVAINPMELEKSPVRASTLLDQPMVIRPSESLAT
jgi:putative transposase